MSLQFRKRIRLLPNLSLNLSRGWPSLSLRLGRVTITSRGRISVAGPKGSGLSWRR